MNNYKIQDFPENGFAYLDLNTDSNKFKNVVTQIKLKRKFDSSLFLDKKDFVPKLNGVNPQRGGFNLAENIDLDFIEKNPNFIKTMNKVLGADYEILLKKFVMGVPESIMPEWILKHTKGQMVANLGGYIKPEYRDITYFHGIDWHQDIIDCQPNSALGPRVSDFITLYVYLEDVDKNSSPLFVIPKSHKLGATTFPHKLKTISDSKFNYSNDLNDKLKVEYHTLIGKAGTTNFWHSSTFHGTQPHINSKPRISLRYLIGRKQSLIDECNKNIKGFHLIQKTRKDIEGEKILLKGNQINEK